MSKKIKKILIELKTGLLKIYEQRLQGVYAFGSQTRNEAGIESDLDVLIVLDFIDNYYDEIKKTSQLNSDLSLKFGISISRVFSTQEQWDKDETIFFHNIRQEAIPA